MMTHARLGLPLLVACAMTSGCMVPRVLPPALAANGTAAAVGASSDYCVVKRTSARTHSVLWLVVWGDASIENARVSDPSAYLSRIATVDSRQHVVFGTGWSQTELCGYIR
jgi:hypothetical protein